MLKIERPRYKELTEEEKENVSDNGHGKEYAGYIKLIHNGNIIFLENDAMEPEDCSFSRDLNWICKVMKLCYEIGKTDTLNNSFEEVLK